MDHNAPKKVRNFVNWGNSSECSAWAIIKIDVKNSKPEFSNIFLPF